MTIVPADVAGWWDYEEGSGTTLTDKSGNGHNGTASGTTWTTGGPTNLPNGLDYVPASDSYVDFGWNPALADGTIAAWWKSDSIATEAMIAGFGAQDGYADMATLSSNLRGWCYSSTGTYRGIDSSALSSNTLYFSCFGWTFSTGSDSNILWINGSTANSSSGNWGDIKTQTVNFVSGRRYPASATVELDGKVYQIMLFNRLLTTTEMGDLYNGGDGITYDALLGQPRFTGRGLTQSRFLSPRGLIVG